MANAVEISSESLVKPVTTISSVWTKSKSSELISLVKEARFLWDQSDTQASSAEVVNAKWNDIGKEFSKTGLEARAQFNLLKRSYQLSRSKETGGAAKRRGMLATFNLADEMQFLNFKNEPIIRETVSNSLNVEDTQISCSKPVLVPQTEKSKVEPLNEKKSNSLEKASICNNTQPLALQNEKETSAQKNLTANVIGASEKIPLGDKTAAELFQEIAQADNALESFAKYVVVSGIDEIESDRSCNKIHTDSITKGSLQTQQTACHYGVSKSTPLQVFNSVRSSTANTLPSDLITFQDTNGTDCVPDDVNDFHDMSAGTERKLNSYIDKRISHYHNDVSDDLMSTRSFQTKDFSNIQDPGIRGFLQYLEKRITMLGEDKQIEFMDEALILLAKIHRN